jgi:predicted Zn-dependent protease
MRTTALLLPVALSAVIGCASGLPPDTGLLDVGPSERRTESQLARDFEADVKTLFKFEEDPAILKYLTDLGREIAEKGDRPDIPYDFRVVASPGELAFTPGDGRVYVSLGLLKALNNRDEMAAVLAHQIAHITRKHSLLVEAKAVHRTPDAGYPAPFEEQADRVAVEYLKRTGYSALAPGELLSRLRPPPRPDGVGAARRPTCVACDADTARARIDALRKAVDAAGIDPVPRPGRKADDPPFAPIRKKAEELLEKYRSTGGFSPRP